jgi:hypothetical protein
MELLVVHMRSRIVTEDKHCTRAAESAAAQRASVGIAEGPDVSSPFLRVMKENKDSFSFIFCEMIIKVDEKVYSRES